MDIADALVAKLRELEVAAVAGIREEDTMAAVAELLTVGRCESCKHWTRRDDFYNIELSYSPQDSTDGYRAKVDAQIEADKLYRRCAAVTLGTEVDRDKLPLAFTMDASQYTADLNTQAAFGCALWESDDR